MYIKREDAIRAFRARYYGKYAELELLPNERDAVVEIICQLPSADVVERKRGEWIANGYTSGGATVYECSVCKGEVDEMPTGLWGDFGFIYCPFCGASMEADRKE